MHSLFTYLSHGWRLRDDVLSMVFRDISSLLQRKLFNEVLYLTITKEVNYKNFSKVADLTVERVKLTATESPRSCE